MQCGAYSLSPSLGFYHLRRRLAIPASSYAHVSSACMALEAIFVLAEIIKNCLPRCVGDWRWMVEMVSTVDGGHGEPSTMPRTCHASNTLCRPFFKCCARLGISSRDLCGQRAPLLVARTQTRCFMSPRPGPQTGPTRDQAGVSGWPKSSAEFTTLVACILSASSLSTSQSISRHG